MADAFDTADEEHPIKDVQITEENQLSALRQLRLHLIALHDQVWWLSLSPEQRAEYENQGFSAPIEHFYGPNSKL